ncbi:MAG: hypothetical protein K9J84_15080, partial [Bacteroidia bacterium]|nr:hypothetical protein [Bacteroidia bacterium]
MLYERQIILDKILGCLNGKDTYGIGILLRETRILLELEENKNKYETLRFYCTWSLHNSLDRNPLLYDILDKINIGFALLNNNEVNENGRNHMSEVIDALQLESLQDH